MLNARTDHAKKIQLKYNYKDEELLSCDKIKLFTTTPDKKTKTYKLVESSVDREKGIEAKTFDKNIDELNIIQQSIYYGVKQHQ
jgi:hypothetical protein